MPLWVLGFTRIFQVERRGSNSLRATWCPVIGPASPSCLPGQRAASMVLQRRRCGGLGDHAKRLFLPCFLGPSGGFPEATASPTPGTPEGQGFKGRGVSGGRSSAEKADPGCDPARAQAHLSAGNTDAPAVRTLLPGLPTARAAREVGPS